MIKFLKFENRIAKRERKDNNKKKRLSKAQPNFQGINSDTYPHNCNMDPSHKEICRVLLSQ